MSVYQVAGKTNHQRQFTSDNLKLIRLSFAYRYRIEEALNKFQFKEVNKYAENVECLCQVLSKAIQLESSLKAKFFRSFVRYLSIQQNIPIQFNVKKIKFDQLTYLLDEWQNQMDQTAAFRHPDRLYSIQHRNILFSRVFVEQKQNIEEYFQTLSQKKMLKGVDLYQLLGEILSHYFLYEFCCDNETFFQKVNSFNNFLVIVDRFINSEGRIIIDNKSKDFDFIKLYEFQALIYFWQSINPEPQLRSDKRYNNSCKQVQTQSHQMLLQVDREAQTMESKQKNLNLEETVNKSLKQLNRLTESQNDPQKLQIIQNICESLRKQKIKLTQYERTQSMLKKNQHPNKRLPESAYYNLNLNSRQRFLNISSDQNEVELQKTERILTKLAKNPQQKSGPISKRKNQMYTQEKQIEFQDQNSKKEVAPQKNKQDRENSFKLVKVNNVQILDTNQNQPSQTDSDQLQCNFQKIDLQLKNIESQNQEIGEYVNLRRIDTDSDDDGSRILNLLEIIYSHYSNKNTGLMNVQTVNSFFADIGIMQEKQQLFELRYLKKFKISDKNRITQMQFLSIMSWIMEEDQDLTFDVIAQFVDLYIMKNTHKNLQHSQNPYRNTKTQIYNYNQQKQSNNSRHTQTIYSHISHKDKLELPFHKNKQEKSPFHKNQLTKINCQPFYQRISSYPRDSHCQKQSTRKRFAYCSQTPKFQHQNPLNRFSQTRNKLFRQKLSKRI